MTECNDGKSNPRFVVTSLDAEEFAAQSLYEEVYCARGDMENRIKEQFWLFADRVSAETMRASQCRLYFSVMAYILVNGLRRSERSSVYHPAEVAQDRSPDSSHCPSRLVLPRLQLSATDRV